MLPCISKDDDGIPPGCHRWWCLFDKRNPVTNDNALVRYIGSIGLPYFDVNRILYLGLASYVTIFAFLATLWGCAALSTNPSVVQRTYWSHATGVNSTSGSPYTMYVGLRSVLFVSDCSYYDVSPLCDETTVEWGSDLCSSTPAFRVACLSCEKAATGLWFLAFSSCFSLLLSLLGAQARLRGTVSDTPIQKILGMLSELNGAVSLGLGLHVFRKDCYLPLHEGFRFHDMTEDIRLGPGYYCYCICCASGGVRVLIHWLTPLPGKGRGFLFPFTDLIKTLFFAFCGCFTGGEGGAAAEEDDDEGKGKGKELRGGNNNPINGRATSPRDEEEGEREARAPGAKKQQVRVSTGPVGGKSSLDTKKRTKKTAQQQRLDAENEQEEVGQNSAL
jgi:hypothetical protein